MNGCLREKQRTEKPNFENGCEYVNVRRMKRNPMKFSIITSSIIFILISSSLNISNGEITYECLSKSSDKSFGFIQCSFCATPRFRFLANARNNNEIDVCTDGNRPDITTVSRAIMDYMTIQGHFWLNNTDTINALEHLIRFMPVRDAILLFGDRSDTFVEFLADHVKLAFLTRSEGPSWMKEIPYDVFMDYILPYAFLNEKRDVHFRWRPRFFQLFFSSILNTNTTTEAMHIIAETIPLAAASGLLELNNTSSSGYVVSWKSETSPMRLSPQDIIELGGGSCTGTAITMSAVARSVGIPIRIAGCSQSIQDDDHHWTEYYDSSLIGPFGDSWHTKEDTSKGNEGGPWDRPSAPMNTCLKYLIPHDPTGLNSIWVSQWSSPLMMPLQWGPEISKSHHISWLNGSSVSGSNRCGPYCAAWGCGMNQTQKYKQNECWS